MAGYQLKGRFSTKWLIIFLLGIWGVIALLSRFNVLVLPERNPLSRTQIELIEKMKRGMHLLSSHIERSGHTISPYSDPNRTGFIGEELTPLTTTLGSLVSKRTSTQPRFAPLIYDLIREAGVKSGDRVAVTASGSFPSLILASILALEEIGAEPVLIVSMGSSTWGANRPLLSWPDMESLFFEHGLIQTRSCFITPGGNDDQGPNLFESSLPLMEKIAGRNGLKLVVPDDLKESVRLRLQAYLEKEPSLFVNIGGSHASLGECAYDVAFPAGLIKTHIQCDRTEPGLITRFLDLNIPVINLLDIPGLAAQYGLPIDPVPFPGISL